MEPRAGKRLLSDSSVSDNSFSELSHVDNSKSTVTLHNKNTKQASKRTKCENQTTLDCYRSTSSDKTLKTNDKMDQQLAKMMKAMGEIKTQLQTNSETLKNIVTKDDLDKKIKGLVSKQHFEKSIDNLKLAFQRENEELRGEIHELKIENDQLKSRLEKLEITSESHSQNLCAIDLKSDLSHQKLNDLEQHGRNNSIRIYGIPDSHDESSIASIEKVVACVQEHLQLTGITFKDIDIAHRLGKYEAGKNRGIICNLLRRSDREQIMKRRRMLKGKKIVIKEDLTVQNRVAMQKFASQPNIVKVWSHNGKILGETVNGRTTRFQNPDQKKITTSTDNADKTSTVNDDSDSESIQDKNYACTTVVNILHVENLNEWLENENHVYIGRNMYHLNHELTDSIWRNPYKCKIFGRHVCLKMFKEYIDNNLELLEKVHLLKGKVLGCFCKPLPCHGDILKEIVEKNT